MKFTTEQLPDQSIRFYGEISFQDICNLELDWMDRALLNDGAKTPADALLIYEILFRRAQEQEAERLKELG